MASLEMELVVTFAVLEVLFGGIEILTLATDMSAKEAALPFSGIMMKEYLPTCGNPSLSPDQLIRMQPLAAAILQRMSISRVDPINQSPILRSLPLVAVLIG
jgi:hypothetical protein